jgi:hypothetical protein
MGGSAFVTGTIVAPGVIRQTGTYQQMIFGELDRHASPRGERLRDLCAASGFEGILSTDIRVPLWEKFIGLLRGKHSLDKNTAEEACPVPAPQTISRRSGRAWKSCGGSAPVCRTTTTSAGQTARGRIPTAADTRPATSRGFRRQSVGLSST